MEQYDPQAINAAILASLKEEDERQNIMRQKENYLDGISRHMEGKKMDGTPIDFANLIGEDHLKRGAEMFGLKEFSPKVQAEVIMELAYLRSDVFRERAVRTFGYTSEEDMPENVREAFYKMIEKGKDACQSIRFDPSEKPTDSFFGSIVDSEREGELKVRAVFPNGNPPLSKPLDDMQIASHEISHHIYNSNIEYMYDTGPEDKVQYGKEDSPLNRLEEDEVDYDKFATVYSAFVLKAPENRKYIEQLANEVCMEDDQRENLLKGRADLLPREWFEDSMEHDQYNFERAAEIHATRMLLLREGIWNPFQREPLGKEQIEQLHNKFPNCRIFEYWDNDKALYFLNNIAETKEYKGKETASAENLMASAAMNYEMKTETINQSMQENNSYKQHI